MLTGITMNACDRNTVDGSDVRQSIIPISEDIPTIGAMHNEILRNAFAIINNTNTGTNTGSTGNDPGFEAIFVASNMMLTKNGLAPMTREQAHQIVDRGRNTMQRLLATTPSAEHIIERVFPMSRQSDVIENGDISISTLYKSYVEIRKTHLVQGLSAQVTYDSVVAIYGEPASNSTTAKFFDILIHSDQFWLEQYPGLNFGTNNGNGVSQLTWGDFMKFLALAAVDAGSGALSGAGYGLLGGPGGAVGGAIVGAVVGGLSSYGANELIG